MSKLIILINIYIIKFYKYFISPMLGNKCRYLPTCSEYFIDSLKLNGPFIGSWMGIKRICKCHPVRWLGGGDGFDPPKKIKLRKF